MRESLAALVECGTACGFNHVAELAVKTLAAREEVRAMCAADKCRAYNRNWSCPPACGSVAECAARMQAYHRGLILQTTAALADSFDGEGMEKAGKEHEARVAEFAEKARALGVSFLLLGAGACKRCAVCGYPASPCRHPDEMTSSMEAYGLVVSDVCAANGVTYYYGENTITYTACVLI